MMEEYCKCKYSISPKVCLRLSFIICHLSFFICHKSYKLTKKDLFNELTNKLIKMSYYWFNKREILQKVKEKYSKEKAAEYYTQNKETRKEKSRERYKNLSQEEKDKIKEYQRKRYQKLVKK